MCWIISVWRAAGAQDLVGALGLGSGDTGDSGRGDPVSLSGMSPSSSLQPDEEFVIHRTHACTSAGKCYRFMRRVIKNVSKRLVKLMVQVNCMK